MNEKWGEIMDIHALLFEMMNEQQNQTEDNVNKTDNDQIKEIQRIKSALDAMDRARIERKNRTMQNDTKQNDMTDQERKSYDCAKHDVMILRDENQKLREVISKLTDKLATMERQLKESEQQNGAILITADTINHVLDRVASVTFRK